MDSLLLQSSASLPHLHTTNNRSVHTVDSRGAIQKPNLSRHRSISTSQLERLHQYALDQANQPIVGACPSTPVAPVWFTPQPSPETQDVFSEPTFEALSHWTLPTPPRSDSGKGWPVDANEVPVTSSISSSHDFTFDQPTTSAEMSSLGFLLPSQYGSTIEAEPNSYAMDQSYISSARSSQPPATSATGGYAHTISSSPGLYQSRTVPSSSESRQHSEVPNASNPDLAYGPNYRRISNSYDSVSTADYSMAPSQTIPSISGVVTQSPHPSPNVASSGPAMMHSYTTSVSRSPSLYESGMYAQSFTSAPATTQAYGHAPVVSQSLSYPPPFVGSSVNEVLAKPLGSDSSIRVLNQRPKPQCWEHGCNGRQFSTFSNLLRHQREKSGSASKSYCPKCGAEFTRTTARNGHLAHDKCTKTRRSSEDK